MLKTNGSPGAVAPIKAYAIDYACACGNRQTIQIGINRPHPNDPQMIPVQDFACAACKGLPQMAKSHPRPIDVSPILRPVAMPTGKPS